MKRFWAVLFAAMLLVFTACGTSPAQEEGTTQAETTEEAIAQQTQEETFSIQMPALPVNTVPAAATAGTGGTYASANTAASGTAANAAAKTTTTAAVTSAVTTTTAATTSTAPAKTTTKASKAPQSWGITQASIKALGLPEVTRTVATKNSYGTIKSYTAQGPTLKSVLQALGADMGALNSRSVLTAACTDPGDSAAASYSYSLIHNDGSIVALSVDGSAEDAPRFFAAAEGEHSDSEKAVKKVNQLTLYYN